MRMFLTYRTNFLDIKCQKILGKVKIICRTISNQIGIVNLGWSKLLGMHCVSVDNKN